MNNFTTNKFYSVIDNILKYDISDIHIIEDKNIYVRKKDGLIIPISDVVLSGDEIYGFLHNIIPANEVDFLLEGNEVDISYEIKGKRFRINAYRSMEGINLALRKIISDPPMMDDLGFDKKLKTRLLNKTKGLILLTGQTGSGKTTSLASFVNEINTNKNCHIITLEDPIEFVHKNKKALVTQREVGRHSKSWSNAIKYSLRQDPDVVVVGEMRDYETISSVMTLVETGHLVLSSLHTIDAVQTISRIIDICPASKQKQIATQLSLALDMVISQCLIKAKGKDSRVPAREIMINTPAISNNIREGNLAQMFGIMETSYKHGMNTLDQHIAKLIYEDQVLLDDAIPYVRNYDNFKNLLRYYSKENVSVNPID